MSNSLPDSLFRELISKLSAAGLPDRQSQSFAEECFGYRDLNRAYFELSENLQLPSDDCFKTLSEAQRIFSSKDRGKYSKELDSIDKFLKIPYSNVLSAKSAMGVLFGQDRADIEAIYAEDPEWLLVSADSVKDFAAYLGTKFADPALCWAIYQKAALLGLGTTQQRINAVLELLGSDIGGEVIRDDIRGDAWLYYRWYSDPIGCIEYMLQCGLTPDKILVILKQEPLLLYVFKENRKRSYNHDQEYIDKTLQKYMH